MRKSAVFDKAVFLINELLQKDKLPYHPEAYCAGIMVSTFEGMAGPISRAFGVVYRLNRVDPTMFFRCTEAHSSFYGENVALEKLLRELEAKNTN